MGPSKIYFAIVAKHIFTKIDKENRRNSKKKHNERIQTGQKFLPENKTQRHGRTNKSPTTNRCFLASWKLVALHIYQFRWKQHTRHKKCDHLDLSYIHCRRSHSLHIMCNKYVHNKFPFWLNFFLVHFKGEQKKWRCCSSFYIYI